MVSDAVRAHKEFFWDCFVNHRYTEEYWVEFYGSDNYFVRVLSAFGDAILRQGV